MSRPFIPFNVPYVKGTEKTYVEQAIAGKHISGDGVFTQKCQSFFEKRYNFKKTFLTTSCSDALEMAALLINITEGDEVILPSFTFVSTANAFLLRGATLVFADSSEDSPNISPKEIERLLTEKTKAVVIMHYAGIACDMGEIMAIVKKHNLFLIEDAALGLDAFYKGKPLGSFGHLATFSFHETKNISCGEGGLLVVNDEQFIKRAEIIREKGTNRSAFFRGEIDKYGWADVGSSFLPSDMLAAYLSAQLEAMDRIQIQRVASWNSYQQGLSELHA
ncbi:MAG: dTDP-4-amino-4,6-dideoxygalactose transaminase, partial [Bacteroidia bacterium]